MADISAFGVRTLPPDDGCGGAETFAEELYSRLFLRGHNITVYCRKYFFNYNNNKTYPNIYKNINLIYLPTFKFIHSLSIL